MRTEIKSSPYCEDLTTDWSKFNMSEKFFQLLPMFTASYEASIAGLTDSEGHSGQVAEQQMILHYLAASPAVKTVCETGFNYGHSSFNFLTANPNLKVNSFDLGIHEYSKTMAKFLPEVLDVGGIDGKRLTVR
ncbi:hypothetical protein HELRODRAFT_172695 [Helobdella robusta]|uniref:Uncharacterized protein n=1 Tax=Helobdella robusta TaxID=6412 RepID=T1F5T1_HELRO|nr:hypothetical protein HELRODRAFT_172695 [Helobdella robusta]ESO04334.1 hypothetical protein HELRODRAFT_172695 [Helobdella robusta]